MAFPVDMLETCSHEELESSAEDYLSELRCGDPGSPECVSLLRGPIPVSLSNVGFVPLYGGEQTQKVLALFAPEDSLTAVALYLADQWWAVDDIVKTAVPSREGLKQVRTLGERVVLYVLNRIIYRKQEMERNEIPFLCHSSTDYAKILWKKGEAIGFYSVKPTGSICTSFLTQSYQLPVLDTMFVRKKYRGKDFGLHMLEDFVDSFTEDALGLRYPLSLLMYTACRQYFEKYPGDQELLWEVEGVGHWHQRIPVARALQREAVKLTAAGPDEAERPTSAECGLLPGAGSGAEAEKDRSGDVPAAVDSLKDAFASTSEGHSRAPASTRTRGSHLKRPKLGRRLQDSELGGWQGEDGRAPQTSPAAPADKLESAARASESSEELPEEQEQSGLEFEDDSSDRDGRLALDAQARLEKQEAEKEPELEPMNGEILDDALKPSPTPEEDDSASEVLDEDPKLQPLRPSDGAVTLAVLAADAAKSWEAKPWEAAAQDKASHLPDSEPLLGPGPAEDRGPDEEKAPPGARRKAHCGGPDGAAAAPSEERSDSGLPSAGAAELSEDSVSENLSPHTTSSVDDQGEEGALEPPEPPAAQPQSALIEVELEDVPFVQGAGPKSQSEEQSEASSEPLDQLPPSAEKAVDSSSEDIEVEAPVVDRRNLRRKAKGHKGPAKKKAKLT